MFLSISRWRAGHLLLSWVAYWIALIAIKLGPGIAAAIAASTGAPDTGSINVGFINDVLQATITKEGATTWTGAASITELALWFAGPPLVITAVWLMRSSRARADARLASGTSRADLAAGLELASEFNTPPEQIPAKRKGT